MRLDRASVVLFGGRLTISLVGFLATVYFARTLGATGLGIYFTFEALISVLGVFSHFGLGAAVEQRVGGSSGKLHDEYLSGALALAILPLGVVSILVIVFGNQVNAFVEFPVVPLVVGGVSFGTVALLFSSVLRGEGKLVESAAVELLGELVRVGSSVALFLAGFGVISLLYGVIFGFALRGLVTFILLDATLTMPGPDVFRSLVDFSRLAVGVNVSEIAYAWTDVLLLSYFLTKDFVGIYQAAWQISVVTIIAAQALGTAVFPAVSKWESTGDRRKIENAFTEASTFALLLVIPAFVGVVILHDSVMTVMYHFSLGGLVLIVLVGEKIFQTIHQLVNRVLLGIDRPAFALRINLVLVVTNVGLNVALIPRFGILGAAVATLLSSVVVSATGLAYLRRFMAVRFERRKIAWQAGAALLMGSVVFGFQLFVPAVNEIALLALVGVGILTYSLLVLVNPGMRARLVQVIA